MKASEIVSDLQNKKGQHVLVTWARHAATVRDCAHVIVKRTAAYVRAGINYSHLSSVQNAITAGVRGPVEKLPFGNWRAGMENFIIDHTPKGEVIPVEYVRLYPSVFPNLTNRVEWILDGTVATYDEVKPFLAASEKRKEKQTPVCFTVKAANILSVGPEESE